MRRIVFFAPDEMEDALKQQASKRRAPVSEIIREAIEEYFAARDIQIETRVQWGKATDESENKETPELVGAGAG
jgi:predicted transcriptional regulator